MTRYVRAYLTWLAAVLTVAGVALWWYQYVESVGLSELRERFRSNGQPADEDLGVFTDVTQAP